MDEQVILAAERLRDDLVNLRNELRRRYHSTSSQVIADDLRTRASQLAEVWLVQIAPDENATALMGSAIAADLSVHFQRVLTFAEHATQRSRYETEFRAILEGYSVQVLIPLKRARTNGLVSIPARPILTRPQRALVQSAFIGQSFSPGDARVNSCVMNTISALGIKAVTGEKPKADLISEKVKRLIDEQAIYVGIFTRRDKIARKSEWTTSPWVIDEKAYAVAKRKLLILLKEQGIGSIGGIQGDYEFIEFRREELESLVVRMIGLFELTNNGLRK